MDTELFRFCWIWRLGCLCVNPDAVISGSHSVRLYHLDPLVSISPMVQGGSRLENEPVKGSPHIMSRLRRLWHLPCVSRDCPQVGYLHGTGEKPKRVMWPDFSGFFLYWGRRRLVGFQVCGWRKKYIVPASAILALRRLSASPSVSY